MKQITVYILIMMLILQPFSKMLTVLLFTLNQDTIAKTLCIKKEEVNNQCQGKCYLKKQLTATPEEDNKKSLPNTVKNALDIHYYISTFQSDYTSIIWRYSQSIITKHRLLFWVFDFIYEVFQPPEALVE